MEERITDCRTCARELLEFLMRVTDLERMAGEGRWEEAKSDWGVARSSFKTMEDTGCITGPAVELVDDALKWIGRAIEAKSLPLIPTKVNLITRTVVMNVRDRFIEQCVK
jgi:hypothetical protein